MDAFDLLRLPARPVLDADTLQLHFDEQAAAAHPDQEGGDSAQFSELTLAFQILSDPSKRLRHLAERENALESGSSPTTIPDGALAHFQDVQSAISAADALLRRAELTSSALARALLAKEAVINVEKCEIALHALSKSVEELRQSVIQADSIWENDRPEALRQIVPLIGGFAFLQKWENQLREKLFRLSQLLG